MNESTAEKTSSAQPDFDCWAMVELMGHQKIAGRVTEKTIAGASFLQVDVPDEQGATQYTRFYAPGAVYCLNPLSRQIAIAWAVANKPAPVAIYDLKRLAADKPVGAGDENSEDNDDWDND
jgi:hypothetical protein